MRVLIAIPHVFCPDESGRYGSTRRDPRPRLMALAHCIHSLHHHFSPAQGMIDIAKRELVSANEAKQHQIDLVICTTGNSHLLDQIGPTARLIEHWPTSAEPRMVGFECHAILRDRHEDYDLVGFLEDDLVLHDSNFFEKLRWFSSQAGPETLLLPNRYELAGQSAAWQKVYIDGNLLPRVTEGFQDRGTCTELEFEAFGRTIRFQRPLNPHSGCFFLTREQMRHWASQPYFLDRDCRFVGPLESAASLGIMKAFRVYKPVATNANFLEIQHFGSSFLGLVGTQVKVPDS